MVPAPTSLQDIDGMIEEMWTESTNQIMHIDPVTENWKTQSLPLARIKKIMKSEEGVYQEMERERQQQAAVAAGGTQVANAVSTRFMIAGEAPVLLGKACELLVKELTVRAWRHTERNRRRTLQRQDIHAAVGESEVYDFLIDIVPRITATPASAMQKPFPGATASASSESTGPTIQGMANLAPVHGGPSAVAAAPLNGPSSEQPMSLSDAEARYAQLVQIQEQMQGHYLLLQQQQRMQPDGNGNAPVSAQQQHPMQPQTVMMNPSYMMQQPDMMQQQQQQLWGAPGNSNTQMQPPNQMQPPAPGG